MKPIAFSPPWQITNEESASATSPLVPLAAPETDVRITSARYHDIPIFVAEDDPISRTLMTGLLSKWNFQTTVAQNGREAMEALRAHEGPAVAILDWMMPEMDGIEICRRVRDAEKMIYVIFLTARGSKESVVEGLQAGADDYLTKPFDKDELLARIRVGFRILDLHLNLITRIEELERLKANTSDLKLDLPI